MSNPPQLPAELALGRLREAHARSTQIIARTPMLTARSISAWLGGDLVLKAENLQRTGSFKLRGAVNKLRSLSEPRGVVAGSAGNHAQALAYAARALDIPCEVFMPVDASIGKLAAVRAFGAIVHQQSDSVDACVELAKERAAQVDFVFVHPFDDLEVIAGQAGVAVELLDDCPDPAVVVVPVGGGGLIAGVGAVLGQVRPEVRVVGVRAERCAPFFESTHVPVSSGSVPTIADGIAVKRPGEITAPLVRELVDEIVTVSEMEIARAMALLLERAKLVVEGAGAASLAAVLSGRVELATCAPNVVVLSGGNVDISLLSTIATRQEALSGRRLRLFTRVSDCPGGLAALLAAVAAANANLVAVDHVREAAGLDVRETGVVLTLETRGLEHADAVRVALCEEGYELAEPSGVGEPRES